MTKKKKLSTEMQWVSLFDEALLKEIPVYYRFMKKTPKEVLDRLEYGNFKVSSSDRHRSKTFFVFQPYMPMTKFIKKELY